MSSKCVHTGTIYVGTRYVLFLDRHRPCRSHNSLIAYDPDPDDPDESLSSFFASFFQDLVLARVSSR